VSQESDERVIAKFGVLEERDKKTNPETWRKGNPIK